MLRSMREGAKNPIMKFFLIFLAGGFAIWGIGDVSTGLFSSKNKAVVASDLSVSIAEAATEFERSRRGLGLDLSTGEAIEAGLLNEVLGSLARRTLFAAEANRMGVTATREMQRQAIANTEAFKDELGQFSQSRFVQTLAQSGLSEEDYLRRLDFILMQEQIEAALTGGARGGKQMAKTIASYQLEQRVATIKTYTAELNKVTPPSQAEIISFYETVKSGYDAPDLRSFDVVLVNPEEVLNQVSLEEYEVTQAFDLRRDEFITPERRQIQQMVFTDEATANAAADLLASGKSFQEVAAETLGWSNSDTQLGLVTKEDLDGELAAVAFSADNGSISGPVASVFGYHLLLVDDIQLGAELNLEDVRPQIETTLRNEKAIDLVYNLVNQIEDKLGTGATLVEAATSINLSVNTIADIDPNGRDIDGNVMENSFADLATDSQFLNQGWALDIDEISQVIESAEDSFFVLQPIAEKLARTRDLEEVRTRVVADWTKIQALAVAKAAADKGLQDVQNTLRDVAPSSAFNRTGTGLDSEAASLIADVAFAQDKDTAGLVETGESVILVRTDDIIAADAQTLDSLQSQISSTLDNLVQTDMSSALVITLSEAHALEINGANVEQLLIGQSSR